MIKNHNHIIIDRLYDAINKNMPKTPEQKIMELEPQIKLTEKPKAFLEQQAYVFR